MTDIAPVVPVPEALDLIDRGLRDLQQRELVAAAEVADLLLDLRTALTAAPAPAAG